MSQSIFRTLLAVFAVISAAGMQTLQAQGPMPPNRPERGLIYDDLRPAAAGGRCRARFELPDGGCTHGPDEPPTGVNIKNSVAPLPDSRLAGTAATAGIVCDGDGVTGQRVQVLYARPSGVTSRYTAYLSSIQTWVTQMDDMFDQSAQQTGGIARVRFVTNPDCSINVPNVTLNVANNASFTTANNALAQLGYNRTDRKYLIFMDANVYCGIGGLWNDDSAASTNLSNGGRMYARVDNGCWFPEVAGHELMHNLGGVQDSAPHTTNGISGSTGGHCYDEFDIMCYSDAGGGLPVMQIICPQANDLRFDCNHDDYFHSNPSPGSYLATHWNTYNNVFLMHAVIATATPGPTQTPTNTPAPTNSPTATNTPVPTNSPTVTNTPAPTNSPTVTNTPAPTNSPTATNTPAPTNTSTATRTPAPPTATRTPAPPTVTRTPLPPPTATRTPPPTRTPAPTRTLVPTRTPAPPTVTRTPVPPTATRTPPPPTATNTAPGGNIAPLGQAYRWRHLSGTSSNANRSSAGALNDGSTTTQSALSMGGEPSTAYEAAGVLWSTPQTLASFGFVNGTFTSPSGTFCGGLAVQATTNGTTWTNVGWALSPAYVTGAAGAGVSYTATGPALTNIRGIRVLGQVLSTGCASRFANIAEVRAFTPGGAAPRRDGPVANPDSFPSPIE